MDNSAQRLLEILEAAKAYKEKQQSAQSAWKEVLHVEDAIDIPDKLGAFLVLSGQAARQIIEADPSTKQAVIYWRNRLFQMCAYGLGSPWKEVITQLDDHTLEYLRMQAKLLDYVKPSKQLPRDRFNEARKFLEAALDEIRTSDLSAERKLCLVDRIRAIITAIDNYAITGQEAVFDNFKLAGLELGEEFAKDNVPGKSNLRKGLTIIAELMSVASAGVTLAKPVRQLLEWLQ